MPALIVGIARHIYNLKSPNDLNEEIRKIFESMAEYINQFSDTNKEQVINEIEEIFKTWEDHLSFFLMMPPGGMTNNPDDNALLAQFNFRNTEEQSEKLGLLMSMRNVDTGFRREE